MAPPTPVKRIYTLCCTLVSKDFTFMSCRPSSYPPPPPKTFNFVRLSEPSQAQSMCTVCTSCVALCQTLKEKVENQKRKKSENVKKKNVDSAQNWSEQTATIYVSQSLNF